MVIVLIRHFQTKGNVERRYIGRTDESIVPERIHEQRCECYPPVEEIVSSPMKRCIETASYIYKGQDPYVAEEFKECDFGLFEYKNYEELKNCSTYQTWLHSGGTIPFPCGESQESFKNRCILGFDKAVEYLIQCHAKRAAFIVHGGTIMSILSAYSDPPSMFYDWQVSNGGGYMAYLDETAWEQKDKKLVEIKGL